MKKSLRSLVSIGSVLLLLSGNVLSAEGGATRDDATKMVKAGVKLKVTGVKLNSLAR